MDTARYCTPHFSWSELQTTSTGLANVAGAEERASLMALCVAVLEPLRELVGPLRITSGYRSNAVNNAVGGAVGSQHNNGEAVDITGQSATQAEIWAQVLHMIEDNFPIDQAIMYPATGHIHLSATRARVARRQLLVKLQGKYVSWEDYRRTNP